jgi:hypothetical protein
VALAITAPGPQGAVGPIGPQGDKGVNTGFGQITYTDRTIGDEDRFLPGVRAPIRFVATPGLTQDFLNEPFRGHVFWSDNKLIGRALGDLLDVQVNLIVTADIAGGELRVDADVGSSLGPIASDTQVLFNGAGVPERVTFRLRVQTLSGFLLNGCGIFLTSNVPLTVISETMLVAPASIYAAGGAVVLPLSGNLFARGLLAGQIDLLQPISFNGAVRASGVLVGALSVNQGVALAGSLFAAGRAAGALSLDISFAGSLSAAGRVNGTLSTNQNVALTGALLATGQVAGVLRQDIALTGAITATGRLAGDIGQGVALSGAITGTGMMAGTLRQDISFSGAVLGRGVLAGTLRQDVALTGAIAERGTLTGSLQQDIALTGAMLGRGLVAGTLQQDIALSGAMTGRGLMAGTLRQDVALSGAMIGRGLMAGTVTVTAGATEDADAASYLNAQTTPPSSTERSLVDALVKGLKADGIWTKIDRLSLLAAETAQAARLDLRNPAKSMVATNLPTFTANRGYTGDASSAFLDFGEPLAFSGANFVQDSGSIFYVCNLGSATVGLQGHIGNTGALRAGISARNNSGNNTFAINDSTATAYAGTGIRTGFRCASRVESTTKRIYNADGLVTAVAVASTSVSATNGCALRSTASYSDDRLAVAGSAGGLSASEIASLNSRLNTYLAAKGAQP